MTFLERAKELVAQMTLDEKFAQMRYDAPAIERLSVPAYNWWNECLHGVARAGRATVFPQAIGMAASFNTDLMHKVANAISDEARGAYNEYKQFGNTEIYQGLTFFSPNINIFRDPRWGRGHETYGEDPYLTGEMGVAFIKGLQGEGKYRKADATIKHYAVHSGPEKGRHGFDARVSETDLYETYLAAFRYCIEKAQPSAVMGAYNRTNGEACCGSKTLLSDILRGEFGFDGYVVSDCGAICDMHNHHHLTNSMEESVALAVNSGCELNCGNAYLWLRSAYDKGLVQEDTVTHAVEKLFEARFRLGMFDETEYDKIPYSVVECEAHRALNLKMAQESVVLLKNNGILPLSREQKIAVIGPNADNVTALLGNYHGTPSIYYTLLRGMQAYTDPIYAKGCHLFDERRLHSAGTNLREAVIAAKNADVVLLCLGLDTTLEGEEGDAYNAFDSGDKTTLDFPLSQRKLYEAIKAVGKPIVFVNVSGSCLDLSDPKEHCDAILQCFYPGAMGGLALADILYGKVSPSGRLPVTFYRSVEDLPAFDDYSMANRTYKFFKGDPVYAFGDGLSYANITETWLDAHTVRVEHKGGMESDYTLLCYEYLPHKTLCGFQKLHLTEGESVTVCFDEKN